MSIKAFKQDNKGWLKLLWKNKETNLSFKDFVTLMYKAEKDREIINETFDRR